MAFIPYYDNGQFLQDYFDLRLNDLLILREFGLIASPDLAFTLDPIEKDSHTILTCGSTCVIIDRPAGIPRQSITVLFFTEIGKQLLQLVERVPTDPQYIEKFASSFQIAGVVVSSGRIVDWHGNFFNYTDLHEVPGNKPKLENATKPNH